MSVDVVKNDDDSYSLVADVEGGRIVFATVNAGYADARLSEQQDAARQESAQSGTAGTSTTGGTETTANAGAATGTQPGSGVAHVPAT